MASEDIGGLIIPIPAEIILMWLSSIRDKQIIIKTYNISGG
jgi:hypothetical protein